MITTLKDLNELTVRRPPVKRTIRVARIGDMIAGVSKNCTSIYTNAYRSGERFKNIRIQNRGSILDVLEHFRAIDEKLLHAYRQYIRFRVMAEETAEHISSFRYHAQRLGVLDLVEELSRTASMNLDTVRQELSKALDPFRIQGT